MDRERRSNDAARNRRILGERDAQVPDVARLAGYLHALLLQLGDLRVDLWRPPAEMIDRPPLVRRGACARTERPAHIECCSGRSSNGARAARPVATAMSLGCADSREAAAAGLFGMLARQEHSDLRHRVHRLASWPSLSPDSVMKLNEIALSDRRTLGCLTQFPATPPSARQTAESKRHRGTAGKSPAGATICSRPLVTC